jgi:PDZ domain-containing protein
MGTEAAQADGRATAPVDTDVDADLAQPRAAGNGTDDGNGPVAAGVKQAGRPRRRRLSRRTWTLLWSLALVIALGLLGGFVTVPYVALGPGPTYDTLSSVNGVPVVSITGKQTYRTTGELRMVTVSLMDQVTLFDALGLWMSGRYALAPREDYFQPGQSEQDVQQQNAQEFKDSQSNAEVAALRYLHYPVSVVADTVLSNGPSNKLILPGDRLLAVDGKSVGTALDPATVLGSSKPGQTAQVTVQTGSQAPRTLTITLGSASGISHGILGITVGYHADVPFKVDISLSDVGGPSAGLMFALAVVDKLTPDGINGGMRVAGTGEIDGAGNVSQIGGIPFKLVAAREAGATVFLTPADNCSEAMTNVPAGLRLVKVTNLDSAVKELAELRAGQPVPGC